MSEPYRVMTVCHGNICRSPMAEVVLRSRLDDVGLGDRVVVDSRGISAEERGNPIDPRARRVLAAHGYGAPDRRATRVRADELGGRDLILAMTRRHEGVLHGLTDDADITDRIHLYRSFDPALADVTDPHAFDMADPWYGDIDDFEECLAQVEAAADSVVAFVAAALTDDNTATDDAAAGDAAART